MIENNEQRSFPMSEDEDATARLLRAAGPRPEAPPDREARVRRAVYAQWQAQTRRRAIGRRMLAGAAVLAMAATLVLVVRPRTPQENIAATPGPIVATVERVDGEARLLRQTPGAGIILASPSPVRTGEWVETAAGARAALRLADGTSIRIDTSSRVRLVSSNVIELTGGALYIDTGRDSRSLEVRTPLGTAHDIGTQFEIRLQGSSVLLRVRTGVVELRGAGQSVPAGPGTELTLAEAGVVSKSISAYGTEWEWAASLAPPFEIEGKTLAAFLEHLCREHGWTLDYADAALPRDASGIILHGSVHGLDPREALRVAITTSGLFHRFRDGELFVSRTADRQ